MANDIKYCFKCKTNEKYKNHSWCKSCISVYNRVYSSANPRNKKLTNGLKKADKPQVNEVLSKKIKQTEEDLINFAMSCRYRIGRVSTVNLIALTDDFLNIKTK